MTAVAKAEEVVHAHVGSAMIVNVRGRVEGYKTRAGKRYTRVLVPSVDAYSHPQLVEIRSRSRLGVKDDEISCNCVLRGFQKKSQATILKPRSWECRPFLRVSQTPKKD